MERNYQKGGICRAETDAWNIELLTISILYTRTIIKEENFSVFGLFGRGTDSGGAIYG
jgi:hypothetical protein